MKSTAYILTLFVLAGIIGCSGLKLPVALKPQENDWPFFGRTEQRINSTDEALIPPLAVAWEHDLSSGMGFGSPVVIDSIVMATNMRGELYAIHATSGKRIGWVSLGESIHGSPVAEGNSAYVAIANTRESLVAYDLHDGKVRWRAELGDIESTPLLVGEYLYIGTTAGFFFCIEKEKGEEVWRFRLPENTSRKGIRSAAALYQGLVIFGAEDGSIYALDAKTGSRTWSYDTGHPIFSSPSVHNGKVFCGNVAGIVTALDAASGVERWRFDAGSAIYATPSFGRDRLLIGTTGGILYALNPQDGSLLWSNPINGVINSSAVVSGSLAYVGTLKRELLAININDGNMVWRHQLNGRVKTTPAVAYGKLYVATDDKLLLAFAPEVKR